eukprot:2198908-Rhodomonas_salina.2
MVKTKLQFNSIVDIVKVMVPDGEEFRDERGDWVDMHAKVKVNLFQEDRAEFFVMSGDTYFFRDMIKAYGGQWDPNEKVWENVSETAGTLILHTVLWWGFDIYCTFNHDHSYAMALATEGYVCAPSPEGVSLESDEQYYHHSRSTVWAPMPTIPQG